MKLKQYQTDTLSILRRFFEEARVAGPKGAYEAMTREPEQAKRLGRYGGTYTPLAELPNVPYVCLRLPTGGGKTILGAHSIAVARDAWVEKDYPMVLWLVPSNTIRLQTAEALKNARHPYRQALDEAFDGRVRVFDIADFTHIRPHDIRDHCCIVVGTIQTLRVSNTEGRKVYAHNENMEPHFTALPRSLPGLEPLDGGGVKFSFANLMHIHRPLMIVDEAHNAVTGLTREMQARVNPSAIIEFTATPRLNSNILHSVTAQELKREEMIKLPIMLSEHDTWQNAVNGAIAARASLAEEAEKDPDYIRPIVLFQAQPKNQEVTVEALKTHLMEVEQIPAEKIAVATGDQRELDGIDLFDPQCPIEYVITVEALKEGWDCSFAYAFCSVSRIQSAVDVEQLLGRVLRMPYAKRRKADPLNRAYAFLSEPSFGEAARSLADKLVAMGFEEDEARDNIEPAQASLDADTGLFGPRDKPKPTFRHTVTATPEVVAELRKRGGVSLRDTGGGRIEIAVAGRVDGALEKIIADTLPETERQGFAEAVAKYRVDVKDQLSPAEQGEAFEVPRLMAEIQGELAFADTDMFMEFHDWSLLDHSPKLGEAEFAIRETARSFEIDLDGNRITYQFADEAEQLALDVDVEGWTPEALVLWLDRQVRQPDIHQSELLRWLRDLVGHLITARGMHITALMRCKFILARKVREKLAAIRQQERDGVYQRYLFAPEAKVDVSFDEAFSFKDGMYWDQRRYRGRWKPRKHFLGPDHVPAFDGAENGEEFQCAQAIDSLPGLKFWIRNVARHPNSFWLPTATDKFYPDFVAQLEDGRLLVVEYKGAHIAEGPDTAEKRTIGELWEKTNGGKGLFIVIEKTVNGKDMRAQLVEKIGA
ncbi:Superfamily II DNA or RNA helicase [Chelatococcus sambhunathii]|uniref:Restriction endonuclease subunit R n=2 Tax=Chelatococcus TaxID=28209 RepID=A0AAC9NY52_9HYPH|nr:MULTISPECIES: DEAD/DEAH box helicase family protein [Chelatococcus]APF36758.1 restriction endonuclease subunit R [Chelatococcus daeguensis]CUA91060.1 Superfamily II DNA or RNA helicase [Chelatococcus sambhunathii]